MSFEFFYKFLKNPQASNFMKILSLRTEFFNADRRTDMTKLLVYTSMEQSQNTAVD